MSETDLNQIEMSLETAIGREAIWVILARLAETGTGREMLADALDGRYAFNASGVVVYRP